MASVTVGSGTSEEETVSYDYTANGLLSTRSEGADTKDFVWETFSGVPLLLSDGEYEYIYGADRTPIAQISLVDGTVEYLHTDLNGSVTASTDANGDLLGTVTYSPYGKVTGLPVSNLGYAGEWVDETTGYSYLRNRWLDTNTGTFLNEDPIVQVSGQSFGYTNGNPLQQIDPLGLMVTTGPSDWLNLPTIEEIGRGVADIGFGLLENSGDISTYLALGAAGSTLFGFAPVGVVLGGLSLAVGGVSLAYESLACLGINMRNKKCEPENIAMGILSVGTGGLAAFASKLSKNSYKGAEHLLATRTERSHIRSANKIEKSFSQKKQAFWLDKGSLGAGVYGTWGIDPSKKAIEKFKEWNSQGRC